MLEIECFYYPACGSLDVLPARVAEALAAERIAAEVTHRLISPEEGARLGLAGSPTVLINGHDLAEEAAGGAA